MLVKAFRHIGIFLVAALLAVACSVPSARDLNLTSVEVAYVLPTSLRSMDGKLLLGIENKTIGFAVQQISGSIRYQDKPIATFVTGAVEVQGRSRQVYELPCTVTLAEGASLLDVLVIASKRSWEGLRADIDIQAALKKNSRLLRKPFSYKDVEISRFTK